MGLIAETNSAVIVLLIIGNGYCVVTEIALN